MQAHTLVSVDYGSLEMRVMSQMSGAWGMNDLAERYRLGNILREKMSEEDVAAQDRRGTGMRAVRRVMKNLERQDPSSWGGWTAQICRGVLTIRLWAPDEDHYMDVDCLSPGLLLAHRVMSE